MKREAVALLMVVFLTIMSCSSPNNNVIGPPDVTKPQAPVLNISLVSGSGASPVTDQVVSIGTKDGTYFAIKLIAQYELIKITSLKLTVVGKNLGITTLKNIRLYEGSMTGTPVATAAQLDGNGSTVTWSATDNILSVPVPIAGVTLYVKADIANAGQGKLGDDFKFTVADTADVKTKGNKTGLQGNVVGTPYASGVTRIVPQEVVIEAISPKTATTVGTTSGQVVGVFKITNKGSVLIRIGKSVRFTNSGASKNPNFALYASVAGALDYNSETTHIASVSNASTALDFDISSLQKGSSISESVREITGGSWRYLVVKTSGIAENNDTFRLSVSALGNIFYEVSEADLGYDGNLDGDMDDEIPNLYPDGTPSLATVTAKN